MVSAHFYQDRALTSVRSQNDSKVQRKLIHVTNISIRGARQAEAEGLQPLRLPHAPENRISKSVYWDPSLLVSQAKRHSLPWTTCRKGLEIARSDEKGFIKKLEYCGVLGSSTCQVNSQIQYLELMFLINLKTYILIFKTVTKRRNKPQKQVFSKEVTKRILLNGGNQMVLKICHDWVTWKHMYNSKEWLKEDINHKNKCFRKRWPEEYYSTAEIRWC